MLECDAYPAVAILLDRVNVGGVEDAFEGEYDVRGGYGGAVVELGVLAELNINGRIVDLRELRCECWINLACCRVEFREAFEGVPIDRDCECRGRGHGVIAVGSELVGD